MKHLKKFNTNLVLTLFILILIASVVVIVLYAFEFDSIQSLVNFLIHGNREQDIPKPAVLTSLGALSLGILALLTLTLSFKRDATTRHLLQVNREQIDIIKHNNLNTIFKEAVSLLASSHIATRMGGVYTLIDIAHNNSEYVKRVNLILCQHISDRSNIEYYEFLKNRNIPESDARILERSTTLRKFMILEKLGFNEDYRVFNNTVFTKEAQVKDEDDYKNLIKQYIKCKEVLRCLEEFYSSDEVQILIRLVFIDNYNLFCNDMSYINNAKLFKVHFNNKLHNQKIRVFESDKSYELKNIVFNYCFLHSVSIFGDSISNLVFERSVVNKSTISGGEFKNIEFCRSIVRECSFIKETNNLFKYPSPAIIFDFSSFLIGSKFNQLASSNFLLCLEKTRGNFVEFNAPLLHGEEDVLNIDTNLLEGCDNIYLNADDNLVNNNSNNNIKFTNFEEDYKNYKKGLNNKIKIASLVLNNPSTPPHHRQR
ncbi:MAG: hypothetical protein LBQ34_02875 [Alphaproteobacteria bacterium]|nr:hypothetical protein [Alphaproteobacteria bacterium]